MIYPSEKKEKERQTNNFGTNKKSDCILHLVYKKVPVTLESRKRQYEEQLRKQYGIKKEKTSEII